MTRFALALLSAFPAITYAQAGDDGIIREIARREKLSVEEVKKDWDEGCESGVTPRMNRCVYFHYLAEDIELNTTYAALRAKLSTQLARDRLRQAQRNWLSFRDATCQYEAVGWTGGTGWGVVYNGCKDALTRERTQKLKEYLACDEGLCR
jgi:uncharacterized protein YecT (DUF1311 family)